MNNRIKAYRLTRKRTIGARRVVQNENGGQIRGDSRKVLRVAAAVVEAVLPVESALEDMATIIQVISYTSPIDLQTGREDNQLVPLTNLLNKPFLCEECKQKTQNRCLKSNVVANDPTR